MKNILLCNATAITTTMKKTFFFCSLLWTALCSITLVTVVFIQYFFLNFFGNTMLCPCEIYNTSVFKLTLFFSRYTVLIIRSGLRLTLKVSNEQDFSGVDEETVEIKNKVEEMKQRIDRRRMNATRSILIKIVVLNNKQRKTYCSFN